MKLPKNYKRLNQIINTAEKAMLDSMPIDMHDDEFGYVMARLSLNMAHAITKLLPLPKEDKDE